MRAKDHQPLPHPDSVGRKISKDDAIMLLCKSQAMGRALRAENARLRKALERIAVETSRRMASGGDLYHFQDGNREAGNVARSTLKVSR